MKIKKSHLKTIGKSFLNLGWLGIAFPEDIGGFDGNINNLMTLMERIGAALVLEPIIFNNLLLESFLKNFLNENNKNTLKKLLQEKKYIHYYFLLMKTIKI